MEDATPELQIFAAIHYKELLRRFTTSGGRPDGRLLEEMRAVSLTPGPVAGGAGSAICRVGQTTVLCCVHLETCPVLPRTPTQGCVRVSARCGVRTDSGDMRAARERESVLASYIHSLLINTRVLDLTQLILKDEKAEIVCSFALCIDIVCMSFDGNLLDASVLSTLAALRHASFDSYQFDPLLKSVVVRKDLPKWKLVIHHYPCTTSFGMFDKSILRDCTAKEEEVLQGRFSIIHNNKGQFCSVYKPGGAVISKDVLKTCIAVSKEFSSELFRLLQTSVPLPRKRQLNE